MTFCLLATDTCLAKLLGGLVIPMAFFFVPFVTRLI